jgi:hypothetical protein
MSAKTRYFVIFLLITIGSLVHASGQECSEEALPGPVRTLVQEKYPDWKVVQVPNLRLADQALWRKSHHAQCPGLASGHFENGAVESYAITLFRKSPKLRQFLIVVTMEDSAPKLHILSRVQDVAFLSVISKLPPGRYPDAEGKLFRIGTESISYEAIEAGAVMYFYRNGVYQPLQSSE